MYIFLYIFYKAYRNMLYIFYLAYRNIKSIKVYIFYNKKNLNPLQKFSANMFCCRAKYCNLDSRMTSCPNVILFYTFCI